MKKEKMDNAKTHLLPSAREDIEKITAYLDEQNSQAANTFTEKVLSALDQLALFPESAPISNNARLSAEKYRVLTLIYNYLLFYKIHNKIVFIYRIINGKRNYGEFV